MTYSTQAPIDIAVTLKTQNFFKELINLISKRQKGTEIYGMIQTFISACTGLIENDDKLITTDLIELMLENFSDSFGNHLKQSSNFFRNLICDSTKFIGKMLDENFLGYLKIHWETGVTENNSELLIMAIELQGLLIEIDAFVFFSIDYSLKGGFLRFIYVDVFLNIFDSLIFFYQIFSYQILIFNLAFLLNK